MKLMYAPVVTELSLLLLLSEAKSLRGGAAFEERFGNGDPLVRIVGYGVLNFSTVGQRSLTDVLRDLLLRSPCLCVGKGSFDSVLLDLSTLSANQRTKLASSREIPVAACDCNGVSRVSDGLSSLGRLLPSILTISGLDSVLDYEARKQDQEASDRSTDVAPENLGGFAVCCSLSFVLDGLDLLRGEIVVDHAKNLANSNRKFSVTRVAMYQPVRGCSSTHLTNRFGVRTILARLWFAAGHLVDSEQSCSGKDDRAAFRCAIHEHPVGENDRAKEAREVVPAEKRRTVHDRPWLPSVAITYRLPTRKAI